MTISKKKKRYLWSTGDTTETITVSPSQTTKYWLQISDSASICTDTITINVATGRAGKAISSLDNSVFVIYPNPVINKSIKIQSGILEAGTYNLTLVNTLGETILSRGIQHRGGLFKESIFLPSNIEKGIYYLRIKGNRIQNTTKFVVL